MENDLGIVLTFICYDGALNPNNPANFSPFPPLRLTFSINYFNKTFYYRKIGSFNVFAVSFGFFASLPSTSCMGKTFSRNWSIGSSAPVYADLPPRIGQWGIMKVAARSKPKTRNRSIKASLIILVSSSCKQFRTKAASSTLLSFSLITEARLLSLL